MRPIFTSGFNSSSRLTRGVAALLLLNASVFVLQIVLGSIAPRAMEDFFALSSEGWIRHRLWQFFTYMFLHGNPLHLLLNLLGLFLVGPELERACGTRSFLSLYVVSGVLGGVGWLALTYPHTGFCVGASGAIFGVLGAYATLFPRTELTLLIFFVLPVTMPAWLLVLGLSLVQLMYLMSPASGGVAYAAHLGGAIAGAVYAYVALRGPRAMPSVAQMAQRVRERHQQREEAHIDAILEKITREGIHSLSARERELLTKASQRRRG